ncbi:hemagglutinin repeat-containing protein [Burkholderia ubonensis]|uniref:hemagglutinin repeat-containing protein n=1 Tax=Burkholderia ubonensis TaxID=101571 RepID=UPI002ABDDE50|nr:hemagglutinin repeat-containing protein [Burkholderia ubonensis]
MNKNQYRLVFSRVRGMLIAVEETVSSSGKAGRGEAVRKVAGALQGVMPRVVLRRVTIASLAMAGVVPMWAGAQVVGAGPHAPAVVQTQSGLPQVNINKPSSAGVSLNTYSQFDVQKPGVILNNSSVITNTQQAGYINGNPNFGPNDAARIIVNQVNSNNPSLLRGYVEVAGQRAEVIISNPSGLVVDGGGFINTSRAILTTGVPTLNADGSLAGFNTIRGLITVQGAGLNATNVDQVDLIARAVQTNAAIYANNLNVVTGANQVNHDTLQATSIQGEGAAPAVAIDVSQLGGMYANRIFLVGTEGGVGVRNAGAIEAGSMGLTLTAQGRLVQSNKATARGNIALSAADGIENSGTTYSQQSVTLNTGADVVNTGTLAAQRNMVVNAGSLNSTGTLGAGMNSESVAGQGGDLQVTTTGQFRATGKNVAGGNATLKGDGVNLVGSETAANGNLSLTATAGDVNLTNATTSAQGTFTANAAGAVINDHGELSSQGSTTVTAGSVSNQGGTVSSHGPLSVTTTGQLANQSGSLVSESTMALRGGTIANNQGTIHSAGHAKVDGGAIDNSAGRIASLNGDGLTVTASGQLTNAAGTTAAGEEGGVIGGNGDVTLKASSLVDSGSISAKAALKVTSDAVNNDHGSLTGTTVDVTTSGALSNRGGRIESLGAATLKSGTFENQRGTVKSGGLLKVDASTLDNTAGRIVSLNDAGLNVTTTGQLANAGGTTAAGEEGGVIGGNGDVTLKAGSLVNSGDISAKAALKVTGDTVNNDHGSLTGQTVDLTASGALSSQAGWIESLGAATLKSGTFENQRGSVQSGGLLKVDASTLDNTAGRIVSLNDGGLNVTTTGQLSNAAGTTAAGDEGGVIGGNGDATVTTQTLVNSGRISARQTLSASGQTIDNSSGTLSAAVLDLSTSRLTNRRGVIRQTGNADMNLSVDQAIDNTQGTIRSNSSNLGLRVGSLMNDGGTIYHAGPGTLTITDAAALSNRGGSIGSAGALDAAAGSIDNTDGIIGAKTGKASVSSAATLTNDRGIVQSEGDLTVTSAGAVSNQGGKLESLGQTSALRVAAQSLDNTNGRIANAGTGQAYIAAGSITNANASGQPNVGVIGGNGDVVIDSANVQNGPNSQIIASANLAFANTDQLTNAGQLTAGGKLTVDRATSHISNANGAISAATVNLVTANLDNTGGQIANPDGSRGQISITTGTLTNASGSIASSRDLSIQAASLVGSGRIVADWDATVSLQGDYTNAAGNQITANRNLTLSTTGQLTNTGTLSAVGNLTTHSNGLVNNGVIVSGTPGVAGTGATTLDAGAGDISNDGRIEGNEIATTGQHLTNTGAMIGGTITNSARSILNDGSRAVMAGTQGVNLYAADEMTNRGGASIISLGDVNIARDGQRDAGGNLVSRTSVVNNLSSSIEADGKLNIAADQLNNFRENVATQTTTTSASYTLRPLPWWKTGAPGRLAPFQDANVGFANAYYVNPADIVSSELVITPDGYGVTKMVVNLPENASVFQWRQSGLSYSQANGGSQVQYQQDLRLTPGAGQVVLYANNVMTEQPNPDQMGGTAWTAPNYVKTNVVNQLGHATYSNQYGNCTTHCVRIEAYPDFTDPNAQMLKGTEKRREGGLPLETQRIATETVTTTTLVPNSGTPAVLTSGGAMTMSVGRQLLNDNGTIAAGGDLTVNGQNVPSGGTNAAIVNKATQLSTTYSFVNQSGYNHPRDPYPGTPAEWITWTNPSITLPTSVVGGTITSNRVVSIDGGVVRNTSVQATSGPKGASAASLGLTATNLVTGSGAGAIGVTGNATGASGVTGAVSIAPGVVQTVSGVRIAIPNLTLPTNGLFSIQKAPDQPYLVATDPRFTSYKKFISSDYMLDQLGFDPAKAAKRLGDGYYESRLVMEQVTNLTGKRFLAGYTSNEDEYRQLMTNGAVFGKALGLVPGVALTDAQMAALTTDVVWMVNQTVTLADGTRQTVLVPQVYLAKSNNVDLLPTGALIAGDTLGINGTDVVNDGGTLASKHNAVIVASNDIQNLGGVIETGRLAMVAGNDIVNRSSTNTETAHFIQGTSTHTSIGSLATIKSSEDLIMQAGRDLTIAGGKVSAGRDLGVSAGRTTRLGTVATGSDVDTRIDARNATGWTSETQIGSTLDAGRHLGVASVGDIDVTGSTLKSGGNIALIGAGNVTIQGATNRSTYDTKGASGKNWSSYNHQLDTNVGSQLSAGGAATVIAGLGTPDKNLSILGSSVVAGTDGKGSGAINLGATGDIAIGPTHTRSSGAYAGHTESSSFLSSSSTDTSRTYSGIASNGSLVSGDSVTASAGRDLMVGGSNVVGQHDVDLSAKRNVDITADYDSSQESSYYRKKKSGLMSSAGLGFTIGSSEQKAKSDSQSVLQSQARSTVGGVQGNVSINAGENVHVGGSDVVAGKTADDTKSATGNINIVGRNVTIDPGQDDTRTHDQQEFKSSGFTVAMTGTLFDTVRNVKDNGSTGNAFQRAQSVANEIGASAADVPSIAVTYGRSESKSLLDTSSLTNAGSTVRGGGNVSVIATGGATKDAQGRATDGDITVVGSAISAGGAALLDANRNVTLAASTDRYRQNSESSSSSSSLALLSSPSLGDLARWIGGTANHGGNSPSPYNAVRSDANGWTTTTTQAPTTVSGNTVTVRSETGDVNVIGSGISGTENVNVVAKQGAINVLAGLETSKSHQESSSRQIGNLGSNGTATGFSVGVANSHMVQDSASETQSTMRSQIASGGNVTLDAKQDLTVTGSDVMAGKDLTLTGKNLNFDPGTDTTQTSMSQHSSQFGVSLALGGAAGNAVAAVNQSMRNPARGGDARLGALDKAQAALATYSAYQVAKDFKLDEPSKVALVKATVSIGGSTSSSESHNSSLANAGSKLAAGENVKLIATGSGAKDQDGLAVDGDINARGTQISGKNVTLEAARDVNLQSAKDTTQLSSRNSSSGGSIGVGVALGGQQNGITVELAASIARGHANGQSVTNRDTVVSASDTLTLKSGRDTNLRGAETSGETINADVGRDLNIQSQQDTATYESKQTSGGFQMSVCVPPICYGQTVSGSANVSQQTITATYQSVNRQSGMFAGEGGYHVTVGKHTQLDGGAIASSAAGADKSSLSTETFGHTNLENKMSYSGDSLGFGASGGVGNSSSKGINLNTPVVQTGPAGKGPVTENGLGPSGFSSAGTSDDAAGTTYATVSPGTITVRGDAGTGHDSTAGLNRDMSIANSAIENTFDARKVQNDLAVQQAAGQVGMQFVGAVGKYLTDKASRAVTKAKDALDDAEKSQDPAAIAKAKADLDAANQQYAMWKDDSASRIGVHAAVSGIAAALGGGNVAGAVGGTIAGDYAGIAVGNVLGDTLGSTLVTNAVAGAAGAAAGGALGGSAGAMSGAGGAFNADLYNRQLHQAEIDAIRAKAKQLAAKGGINYQDALERLSAQALRDVDLQFAKTHPGVDVQAQAWLDQVKAENPAGFNNMPFFQATDAEYKDPTKYADTKQTNPDIYQAANKPVLPGTISPRNPDLRAIATGNAKAVGNSLIDLYNKSLGVTGVDVPNALLPHIPMTAEEQAAATATGIMALPWGFDAILMKGRASNVSLAGTQSVAERQGVVDALLPDADFAGRGVVRTDLADHLVNVEVVKKKNISGGHNADNFYAALEEVGGVVVSSTEKGPGIYEIQYQLPNSKKPFPKTIYDPAMYPDMPEMANQAANKALTQYQITGDTSQKVVVGGIEFFVPIRVSPNTPPSVPTAYPIGGMK